MKSGDQNRPIQ